MGRPITELQRAWLAGELDAWRSLGIVTADQAGAALGLYATSAEAEGLRRSRTLRALMALAALMVGLGVLLLVGYNWEAMPAAAKVAAVLGGMAAAHAAGWFLRFRREMRAGSEAAFFLGSLIYGAGIWLVAQVFHISAHAPDGFWWWALGVLPFALVFDSVLMHVLFVALMATWAGYEVLGFEGGGAWFFGRWPQVPNGAYGLLPLAVPGIAWAYRRGSPRVLSLYVALVAWWATLQPFAWESGPAAVFFIGAVGGLLLLAAEAHREGDPMAAPYRFCGTGLIAGALVPPSFHGFNNWGGQGDLSPRGVSLGCATLILAAAVLAGAALARQRSRPGPSTWAGEIREVARRGWFPCAAIALMAASGFWDALGGDALATTVAANAAMVALAIRLMQGGLKEDRGRVFAAGVAYFLFWAVLRYVDLFGDYFGILGAALMFFICGASLFGVALFWRQRKEVHLA